ncbi:MAG: hypothetical protein HY689_05635 [Chloroflexi bacterium]|nr:hypothetical protein [Chloroflexota bacterium]
MSHEALLAVATIGVPLLGTALVAVARLLRRTGRTFARLGLAAATLAALLVAWLWAAAPRPLSWQTGWIEVAGIGVGLYVDDLSLLFAVLVTGISLLSLLYSLRYLPHELEERRAGGDEAVYYGSMLLFTGAMLGMVFSGDVIQLYVFWELTGVASFLLIGLHWQDAQARAAAVKTLLITTGSGGLALLVGVLLLGGAAGTYALPEVLARREALQATPVFGVALVLLLLGAAAKSAQFPFHVWLPDAMIAPTPVSAFLHSAALVAAGVYLLARFHPVFAGAPLWGWSVAGVGVASMLVGGILALRAREFKALLAYSTISQYGFIFTLLGYGSPEALAAALFSFWQHGLVKAGLFFAAGIVTYATGLRTFGAAGGLWARLPVAFVMAATLALSLGGVPPLAGFWMKEVFLGATLATHHLALVVLAVLAGALTLTYMLRFLAGAFLHGAAPPRTEPVPATMLVAPGVLAALTVLFGLWPGLAGAALVQPAAAAPTGAVPHLDLAYHLDLRLALSLVALGLGAAAFLTLRRWAALIDAVARPAWSLDRLYTGTAAGVGHAGRRALRVQNGFLLSYLHLTLLGLVGLLAFTGLFLAPVLPVPTLTGGAPLLPRGPLDGGMALLLLLIAVGAVLTFVIRYHLHMILALSVVGYVIGALFALEFALDVGLVQVLVETIVAVIFVIMLALIPPAVRQHLVLGPRQRLTLVMVALSALGGLGSAWLSWLAITHTPADPIAPWFNEHAFALTQARDVVAAILVDFRALDTLGEITVFAIAATGVYTLVRLIRGEAG